MADKNHPLAPNPDGTHPLAPEVESRHEVAENQAEAVELRAGVEVGAMRWVLGLGLLLAILVMLLAYLLGYLPAIP
jgi:hypothetical protein